MNLGLIKQFIWVFVALIIAIAIQVPMLYHGNYNFLLPNTLIVLIPILSIRNSLDFYQISYHKHKYVRYLIIASSILMGVYLINRVEVVMGLVDSMDIYQLIKTKHFFEINESASLLDYIKTEYLFFTIASIICMLYYIAKIITSFWKKSVITKETKL